VELGKLAQQNGHSPDVKSFGARMVQDHSRANDQLTNIAKERGVQLPQQLNSEHMAMRDRLAKLQGDAFDRAYIKMMVADHDKDMKEFRRQAQTSQDRELKRFAARRWRSSSSTTAGAQYRPVDGRGGLVARAALTDPRVCSGTVVPARARATAQGYFNELLNIVSKTPEKSTFSVASKLVLRINAGLTLAQHLVPGIVHEQTGNSVGVRGDMDRGTDAADIGAQPRHGPAVADRRQPAVGRRVEPRQRRRPVQLG